MTLRQKIGQLLLNREKFLEKRPVASLAETLGRLSLRWLKKKDFYRKKAARRLVRQSKFSKAMAEELLNSLFRELTPVKLKQLLKAEFENPRVLDGFQHSRRAGCRQRARAPRLITHILAGNVPNPSVMSVLFGMLMKSANIAKVSQKDPGILDIYLESLRALDKPLASVNLLLDPRDRAGAAQAMSGSDLVIGYGSDETLRDLKAKIPFGVDFVGYGHRVSFALYTQEAVTPKTLGRLARDTARDIWMMDQRGCLSPLALFLEKKGEVPPSVFAEGLALELQRLSARGAFCPPETVRCAALRSSRDRWKMRGVAGKRTLFWESRPPGEWLVLYEEGFSEPLFSKGRPVIVVRGVPSVRSVFERLKPFRKYLQAAALEANASRREKIAQALSELGVSRVCRAGALQDPPLRWHHDGRWNLAHWVRWTDVW